MAVGRMYAMIISVPALLSAISTGVRSVPWVEWGPSSTHMFKMGPGLKSAGPFWITDTWRLEVRRYDLRRTPYIQSTAEDTSSLQSPPLNPDTVEGVWNSFETHMPYHDARVPASDGNILRLANIVADREWWIRVEPLNVSSVYTSLKHSSDSLTTCADRGLGERELLSPCIVQVKHWHELY